jgi:hypothetical protein
MASLSLVVHPVSVFLTKTLLDACDRCDHIDASCQYRRQRIGDLVKTFRECGHGEAGWASSPPASNQSSSDGITSCGTGRPCSRPPWWAWRT